jgi:hypothetical protein
MGCDFTENLRSDPIKVLKNVCQKIDSNCIDPKQFHEAPKNHWEREENAKLVFNASVKIGLNPTGLGTSDLIDKKRKNLLSISYQLMRSSYLNALGGKTEK